MQDLEIWQKFLQDDASVYWRPFMDFDKYWHASEIEFYTDASKNFSLGFGGYCERSWMQGFWNDEVAKLHPSIQFLELYALTAGFLA